MMMKEEASNDLGKLNIIIKYKKVSIRFKILI
jgi:hypothetical protein